MRVHVGDALVLPDGTHTVLSIHAYSDGRPAIARCVGGFDVTLDAGSSFPDGQVIPLAERIDRELADILRDPEETE